MIRDTEDIAPRTTGTPIRITGASMTGTPEVFWYVRSDSEIKSVKDLAGKSVGFSQQGSSTHLIVMEALKHFGVNAKVVPSPTGRVAVARRRPAGSGAPLAPESRVCRRPR